MVMSFTVESENQGCGGTGGGNDCLWWCFKVSLRARYKVFVCVSIDVYFCLCIGVYLYAWRCVFVFVYIPDN